MSDSVLVALISSGFGLLGVLIGVFKEQIIGVFQTSKRNISGQWVGNASDVGVPEILENGVLLQYTVSARVKQIGKSVSGTATVTVEDRAMAHKVKGHMISDDLVQLNYKSTNIGVVHSGVLMLKLNGTGRKMSGYFLSKRAFEDGYVFGTAAFKKGT